MKPKTPLLVASFCLAAFLMLFGPAQAQGPVVRAVLFFSPTCPHCHKVISEDLPGIFERHGGPGKVWYNTGVSREELAFFQIYNGRLEVMLVDISLPPGNAIYRAAIAGLQIPDDRRGVPTLVIGKTVLVGSFEIPNQFPGLIEAALGAGGQDWPAIDGVRQAALPIPEQPLAAGEAPVAEVDSAAAAAATDIEGDSDPPPVDREAAGEEPDTAAADEAVTVAEVERTEADPSMDEAVAEPVARSEPRAEAAAPSDDVIEPVPAEPAAERPDAMRAEPSSPADSAVSREGLVSDPLEASAGAAEVAETTLEAIASRRPTMLELYRRDPVGNSASVLVLIGMIASLVVVALLWRAPAGSRQPGLAVPLLALVGIVVATYLTYVESTGARAVCGPVGDCNAVQQSEYARLFGVVPVGALGLLAYIAILTGWVVARRGGGRGASWAALSLLAITVVGTLFSIYLTFLEPFVIGATCAWCLTSAVVITVLMLLVVRQSKWAWRTIRAG